MSLIPRFTGAAMSPLSLGEALTQRDVGFGQFLGARAERGFADSGLGLVLDELPRRVRSDDEWEQAYQERVETASRLLGRPLNEDEVANQRQLTDRMRDRERDQFQPIDREVWEASPAFREDIPWEDGMTAERAEALAERYDNRRFLDWLIQNHEGVGFGVSTVTGFAAEIAGSAASPESFLPIAGPAMRAAAVARLGSIGGRAAIGSFEGVLGTAAVLPAIAYSRRQIGEEMTYADMALDVAMGAIVGGAFGAGVGALARPGEVRHAQRLERERALLTDLRVASEALTKVEIAKRQIAEGVNVDVPPVSDLARGALLEGLSIQDRMRFVEARQRTAIERAEVEIRRQEAEAAGEILLRPETTLTPLQESAIRGETLAERTRAREALTRERESRRAARLTPERLEAERRRDAEQRFGPEEGRRLADEAVDVVTALQRFGVAPSPVRRRVKDLTPLERMALFDPNPQLRTLARAEIDRRLSRLETTQASATRPTAITARTEPVANVAAETARLPEGVDLEAEAPEMAQFAEMERAGNLTDAERAEMQTAIEAEAKAARASEAYTAATACALR